MDMNVKGGVPYPLHKVGLHVQRGGGAGLAGGKVIEDKGKVCHAHGNLTLHEGVGNTPGEIALARACLAP